ncbi:MAG: hypothetical protein U0931_06830 [Vulcanimicrobiota bacterium]
MADDHVRVPRAVLIGLVTLLAVSLLGFAFLLGRQSAPPAAPPASSPVALAIASEPPPSQPLQVGAAPVPAPPAPPPAPAAAPPPVSAPVPAPVAQPAPPPPPPPAPLPPPNSSPPPIAPVSTGPAPAVKSYFVKIDKIMAQTEAIGDANAFATQVLQQGMNGKTEGFDSLIASTRKAAQALRAISPPPTCREHHQLLLRQTDQSLILLEKVKKATVTLDTGELAALGAQGQTMQSEANRLKQLDEQLRRGN